MPPLNKTRRLPEVVGVIFPDGWYTKEGLMHAMGWGRKALEAARASGLVKPVTINNRIAYSGRELIAWIESQRNSHASHH